MAREGKNFFQGFCQGTITGLSCAAVVCRVKAREYVATRVGLSGKLGEDRKEEVRTALLIFITKVAIKVN